MDNRYCEITRYVARASYLVPVKHVNIMAEENGVVRGKTLYGDDIVWLERLYVENYVEEIQSLVNMAYSEYLQKTAISAKKAISILTYAFTCEIKILMTDVNNKNLSYTEFMAYHTNYFECLDNVDGQVGAPMAYRVIKSRFLNVACSLYKKGE